MGCDIHMTLEIKRGDHWLGLHSFEGQYDRARSRNYVRFNAIAGVRGDGPATPRRVPIDASELARYQIDEWSGDGHSHTWLTLEEAVKIWQETDYAPSDHSRKYPDSHYFDIEWYEDGERPQYRLVIWFDN